MSPILIAAVLFGGAATALRRGKRSHQDLITPRPYNNRHNDASAARDESRLLG